MPVRITVLVDNFVPRPGRLTGEYGLSLLVEKGDLRILYDTGATGEPLLRNAREMGVDLDRLDYIVLSHRHADHTGGLMRLLEARRGSGPVLVAHPDLFEPALVSDGGRWRDIGAPFTEGDLRDRGIRPLLIREPLKLDDGVWISGEVPRDRGPSHAGGMFRSRDGRMSADDMMDDLALYLKVGDEVVAVTGCGHAGVENIVEHGERLVEGRLGALVGGLHLLHSEDRRIEEVAGYLSSKAPRLVVPLHCTGPRAHWQLSSRMGRAYRLSGAGGIIEYG
ncbi:MAG: MBL fold metallo-hydrolase [Conexivisphaera sp.]|jgi:7,8-dihydropterin-6-yl-methyl-4-(beta-D-ribofuranosyl)aminobenzene 5'-phosphate synthase